jgi:hypothetical protein
MRKHYRLIILVIASLFLSLIIVGCGAPAVYHDTKYSYYTIHNGIKTPCNGGFSNCGNDFYEVGSPSGSIYHCTPMCNIFAPTYVSPTTCIPNYAYDNLVNDGLSWVVTSRQQDTNNTVSPAQVTFTSTTSKTVTVTDKLDVIAKLGGDADILIADITLNVKAEIDYEVTQTVDATIGNAYTVSILPGETAYGNYGVRVQITSGHLYDKAKCEGSKSDSGMDITYVPIDTGWCVWTSNQSPSLCPSL